MLLAPVQLSLTLEILAVLKQSLNITIISASPHFQEYFNKPHKIFLVIMHEMNLESQWKMYQNSETSGLRLVKSLS